MLRITAKRQRGRRKVLYLEGKISRDWVKELCSEIKKGIDERGGVILDFSNVHYVDEEGARMLRGFPADKVEKKNLSLLVRELLNIGETR
jgi:anti-anti-sigma regulatory factor